VSGSNKIIATLAILIFIFSSDVYSQLVLNEMMPFNGTTISDQFNEYPDWVEVYNAGTETLSLENYWLSDDKAIPKKWNLPAVDLQAGEYMVYFASGRDITTDISYWHTVADLADQWKYYLPVSDIGDTWKSTASAASSWPLGKIGIGYSDNDDSTQVSHTISLYMQYTFDLTDPSQVNRAALYMDYDDGFIAYLNGSEIARSSNMGQYGDVFAYNDPSLSNREAIMYNGNTPELYSVSDYIDLLQSGENLLSIEVHNVSLTSSDLSAIPFFLLGFSSVQDQFSLGNSHIVVNNVFPHTNFKIAYGGEAIYLADGTGSILDSIPTYYVPQDYSLGRIVSDPEQFGYFEEATPGYENSPVYAMEFVSDSVAFIASGKEYDPVQDLELNATNLEDVIYYTRDGSEPGLSSSVYSGNLSVNSTTVIRARVIRENQLPGPVTTKTFFTGRKPEIPRVSVSTAPGNLYDYNEGILANGPNWTSGNPHWGANYWQDWEKPVNLEIYDTDGTEWLNQGAGTKVYGAWSRANAQKSLSFFARSAYGDGSFSKQLFEKKDISKFESFIIRNGGNDFNQSLFRDAISAYLADDMDLDHQAYQPAVVYLNGDYHGIMNMREKINEHFIAANNHVHPGDVNLLEAGGKVVDGSAASYSVLLNYIRNNNLSTSANYEAVQSMMDVDNFIRYWILQVYIDNRDWPGNNIKFWSTDAEGSKYRWIVYDTDFGLWGQYWDSNPAYVYNTLRFAFSEGPDITWANQQWATEIIRNLIVNTEFKNSFINQVADRMNTTLLPENIIHVVDSFQLAIQAEAPYHFQRWGNTMSNWNNKLDNIRAFANERPSYMIDDMLFQFSLNGTARVTANVTDPGSGSIRVNSIVPKAYPFSGTYYKNIPIQLEAIPAPGYRFSHWEGDVESSSKIIDFSMAKGGSFNAVFYAAPELNINLVINEINYASSPERNTEDWVELYNGSLVSVDLGAWRLMDNSSGGIYFIPSGTIIPSKGYMVFCRDIPDFKRFYPESSPVLGELSFGLNSDSDGISLLDPFYNVHDEVIYGSVAPWPEEPNGTGATLELIHHKMDNAIADNWKASLNDEGTPNQVNSQFKIGIDIPEILPTLDIELYPTVFSDITSLRLSISMVEQVSVSVVSMTGRVVEVLANGTLIPGEYQYDWRPDASIEPGMYFIRVSTNSSAQTFKVIYQ